MAYLTVGAETMLEKAQRYTSAAAPSLADKIGGYLQKIPDLLGAFTGSKQEQAAPAPQTKASGIPTTYLLVGGVALVGLVLLLKKKK